MSGCIRLEFLPSDVNLASLHYLNLTGCARLRSFPRISSNISRLLLGGTSIVEDEDCFFIGIISRLTELVWSDCPMRYMPSDFCAEYLVELIIPGGAESENNGDVMKRLREARGECGESSRCLVASSTFDTLSRKGPIPTRRVFWSSCRFLVNRSDTNCWDCEIPCPTLSYLINTPCLIIQCGTLIDISQANPVILLPFIRAAPSLTVSFFYYRDDKAKPCYSHYVYDLNAETENSDEVTQCRCVTEES
uniref:Uncharacterized protein n=1 Tax=Brassica campestris TaxID=3711 RepID=M4DX29_BRACM